jgi:hypothetical protein
MNRFKNSLATAAGWLVVLMTFWLFIGIFASVFQWLNGTRSIIQRLDRIEHAIKNK